MTTHAIKIIRMMELQGKKIHSLTSDVCPQHRNFGVNQIKKKKKNIPPLFFSSWYSYECKVIFQAKKNEIPF